MTSKRNPCHTPILLQQLVLLAAAVWIFITDVNAQEFTIDATPPAVYPAEIVADWKDQDGLNFDRSIEKIKASIPEEYANKIAGTDEAGYLSACHWRRVARMHLYSSELEHIMFAKHHNFGGSQVGYHDNADADHSDPEWSSQSALCVLNMKNYYATFTEVIKKTDGVVRDPCISFDGTKVLFAQSGNGRGTGYKIYEMEIADTTTIRQLTNDPDGVGVVADFEPCYLPNGDIAFSSTRNFGSGADGKSPVTNMFLMNGQGKYIRQVGFDQVHTFYPVLREDGSVLYTRWEYNDRDVTNSMGLFNMNPDGCRQTEWFGNQTSWPMTMIHARPIPGTRKVMAIAGGHIGPYSGELMIINPEKGATGFNGTECVQMIAPRRDPKPTTDTSDVGRGSVSFTFQTPYPFDEECFLVSWRKSEREKKYNLYFMDVDGNRELLAWADQSVSQPVVVTPWKKIPPQLVELANYNDSIGTFTLQDVYYGEGMKGIEKGTAKTLRVIKLNYRAMGACQSGGAMTGSAPSGAFSPTVFAPISQYGASWDTKEVLGEAKIYPDGSAGFIVPARIPVYFQVLDDAGYCIATMRSWSTLMPGEVFACSGCHESKNLAPPAGKNPQALVFQKLDTPLGIENRPFDYKQMIQPIFDQHCVSCHTAQHPSGIDLRGDLVSDTGTKKSWTRSYSSLLSGIGQTSSNKAINICTIFSPSEQQPPYSFGACLSGIMKAINGNVPAMKEVTLSQTEKKTIACWIDLRAPHSGTYSSYMSAEDSITQETFETRREKWTFIEAQNLKELAEMTAAVRPNDHGSAASSAVKKQLFMEYLPQQHALVLKKPSQGTIIVVDLGGRVMFRRELVPHLMKSEMTLSLPTSLGAGLYLARFNGVRGEVQQATVSLVR